MKPIVSWCHPFEIWVLVLEEIRVWKVCGVVYSTKQRDTHKPRVGSSRAILSANRQWPARAARVYNSIGPFVVNYGNQRGIHCSIGLDRSSPARAGLGIAGYVTRERNFKPQDVLFTECRGQSACAKIGWVALSSWPLDCRLDPGVDRRGSEQGPRRREGRRRCLPERS